MRVRSLVTGPAALLVGLALACPAGAAPAEPQEGRRASRVVVAEEAVDKVEIVAARTEPPSFTLVLVREMPTPGWTWRVDAVEVDKPGRRIVARVTEAAPDGITTQVITPTRFELPLGQVETGSWFLELSIRRDPAREHRPALARIIEAR